MRQRFLLLPLLMAAFLPTIAWASWNDGGNAVCTAPAAQQSPLLVADGSDGAILAWHDSRSGDFDVYAQRIDGSGNPLWTPDGVAVAASAGTQKFPVLIGDGAGGAILSWKDDRSGNFDIRAQRLDADGRRLWGADGVVVCGDPGVQQDVQLVGDGAGGAILAWRDFRGGGVPQLYAQRLSAAGAPLWSANGIPICSAKQQYTLALTPDGAGGAIAVFQDYRSGSTFDIQAQRIDGSGRLLWSPAGVAVSTAAGNQMDPRLLADGFGGVFVAWYDARGGGYDIYAQRLTGAGAISAGWPVNGRAVCTAGNDQFEPVMTPDSEGGIFLAWYDNRAVVGVFASRLTGAGQLVDGWPVNGLKVNESPSTRPAIFPGVSGGAVVAWHGTPGSTNLDVVATEITPLGAIADGWPDDGLYLCTEPGDQMRPGGISLPGGDAILAWSDMRSDAGDIYVTRIGARLPNLSAENAGPGFDLPLVPRNRDDATPSQVHLTNRLDGNAATTRLNWTIDLSGSNVVEGWGLGVDLDGSPLLQIPDLGPSAPGTVISLNQGPFTVRGGRHTLTLRVDPDHHLLESSEADNLWSRQFVWTPLVLSRNSATSRPAPPERGSWSEPNADGFAFLPSPGVPWAIAAASEAAGTGDVDLILYDDAVSATTGFSHRVAESTLGSDEIDFIVGSAVAHPVTAAVPASVRGALGSFSTEATDASGLLGAGDITQWRQRQLPPGTLVELFEADLVAGRSYRMSAVRAAGSSPLEFALFPTGAGSWSRQEALAHSFHRTLDGDGVAVLDFHPPASGRYPLAVYRATNAGLREPLVYHLFWNTSLSGVEEGAPPAMASLAAAVPNPFHDATTLLLSTPSLTTAHLAIFDAAGRLVRVIAEGAMTSGRHELSWDGRDDAGAPVTAGVYFARFRSELGSSTQRLVVSR